MNEFGFVSATMAVFYTTGLDEFNEPVIKSTTYRNISPNVSATQMKTVAQALIGLTDYGYVETVKTQKDLIA
ncbi:hypothetical protein DCE79_10330 [Lysinibacillus sp. 2017]|uniref:DUF1659 domain-containing protein n=1 Tax=unclassified Lysinibacillus TaxID=2636778 RepID=UPI000D525C70|nr:MULTISPECIES: DUF1659 domain-containing protein [unclassified Lysinibacillus]AWE07756.1 hypothetical protein DCE79_10330 [Lysinibacillus sp. 2017]TGN32326.1 DUF1659 domain-containing protein [Lysinibacillus sp. S2017]